MNHRVTEGTETHRGVLILIGVLVIGDAFARGQDVASRNIDKALEAEVSVEWKRMPLEKAVGELREKTRSNLVVNWAALALVGVARDVPVTLRLNEVSYEAVVRSLLLVLAPREKGLNYLVGDNAVEISTNAVLGKARDVRLHEVSAVLMKGGGEGAAGALKDLVRTALESAGEKIEPSEIVIQDQVLAANVSKRGDGVVRRFLLMFATPVRFSPREGAVPGTAESVRAKKTADALKSHMNAAGHLPLAPLAAEANTGTLNVIVLPGATAALAGGGAGVDFVVDDAGIVEIGSIAEISGHAIPGVYDLTELVRRRTLRSKNAPAAEMDAVATELKTLLTAPSSITVYNRDLVIFAPAKLHREIAAKLSEMYK